MKYRFLFFAFSLTLLRLTAQNTVIQGSAGDFEGKVIRALLYEDYITLTPQELAKDTIEEGEFRLTFELKNTREIVLQIEDKRSSLFTGEGQVYNVTVSEAGAENAGKVYDKVLKLTLAFPQTGDLNVKIKQFNLLYQQCMAENYRLLAIQKGEEKIEAFTGKLEKSKAYAEPEFLNHYVTYALANLKDIAKVPQEELTATYLKGKPVLHWHKEYMNFFRQFFQSDFEQLLLRKEGQQLMKMLLTEEDARKAATEIKSIKNFDQQELAELYLIHGLFDAFHLKRIKKEVSLKLLRQLSEGGSSAAIQKTAANAYKELRFYVEGTPAPDFRLKDTKGKMIALSDFRGKPVYLTFWSRQSTPALREMQLLQKMQAQYRDKVHFISINVDPDPAEANRYVLAKNYDWTFLQLGENQHLRNQYKVKTLPIYYWIDEQGNFIRTFAPGPAEMDRVFHDL